MSRRATVQVQAIDGRSTVDAGAALGAVAGLAAGAVVGLGVLVVGGIILCGRMIDENYKKKCKEWTDTYDAARAPSQEIQECLDFELARIAFDDTHQHVDVVQHATTQSAAQEAIREKLQLVHSVFDHADNTADLARIKVESERTAAANALKREIATARDLVPQAAIVAAEACLNDTVEAMEKAVRHLHDAERAIKEASIQQKLKTRQVQQLLREVMARLNNLDSMATDTSNAVKTMYAAQRQAINARLQEVRDRISQSPGDALALAEMVQHDVHSLSEVVSTELIAVWDRLRRKANQLQGTLVSLNTMVSEAAACKLTDAEEISGLTRRIANAQRELQTALNDSSSAPQRLKRLSERVDLLKEEVFTLVQTKQQQEVARKVAETMVELGFESGAGGKPAIMDNGDVVRIEAVRVGVTDDQTRDDKIVSFDITRDGDITYDFMGYVGNACVAEAERVFASLRKKGVYITTPEATDSLRKVPATQITAEVLQQERFRPNLTPNKAQSLLAERLKSVLERMNYPTIKQSTIGGTIELEAFKGSIGYHVVLSPEGMVQVYKGKNRVDVSADQQEPLMQHVQEQQIEIAPQVVEGEEEQRQSYGQPRTQQILGN